MKKCFEGSLEYLNLRGRTGKHSLIFRRKFSGEPSVSTLWCSKYVVCDRNTRCFIVREMRFEISGEITHIWSKDRMSRRTFNVRVPVQSSPISHLPQIRPSRLWLCRSKRLNRTAYLLLLTSISYSKLHQGHVYSPVLIENQ